MIDFENEILTAIKDGMAEAEFEDVALFDEMLLAPSVFPCVCIEEIDNYTYVKTIDSASDENHAFVAYEVNVYSNRTYDKKWECKDIFAVVSNVLTGLGFTRLSMTPIYLNDTTVYRLVGRFRAVISKTGEICNNRR